MCRWFDSALGHHSFNKKASWHLFLHDEGPPAELTARRRRCGRSDSPCCRAGTSRGIPRPQRLCLRGCQADARLAPQGFVVHTAEPISCGADHREADLLAPCHRRSLEVAAEKGARSVAFPAVSTGVYGCPVERAALIAVQAVSSSLPQHPSVQEVMFCRFSAADGAICLRLIR